ncbi:MAG: hypothetical protein WC428_08545 [Candidatus Paceibacterota bacterium]|jgi:hypothetical protein
MGIIDTFLDFIIWIVNNTILRLPESISALPISTIRSTLNDYSTTFASAYGFADHLIPIGLIMILFGAIIIAEVALHLGWKGMKYIINLFRGSGG